MKPYGPAQRFGAHPAALASGSNAPVPASAPAPAREGDGKSPHGPQHAHQQCRLSILRPRAPTPVADDARRPSPLLDLPAAIIANHICMSLKDFAKLSAVSVKAYRLVNSMPFPLRLLPAGESKAALDAEHLTHTMHRMAQSQLIAAAWDQVHNAKPAESGAEILARAYRQVIWTRHFIQQEVREILGPDAPKNLNCKRALRIPFQASPADALEVIRADGWYGEEALPIVADLLRGLRIAESSPLAKHVRRLCIQDYRGREEPEALLLAVHKIWTQCHVPMQQVDFNRHLRDLQEFADPRARPARVDQLFAAAPRLIQPAHIDGEFRLLTARKLVKQAIAAGKDLAPVLAEARRQCRQ